MPQSLSVLVTGATGKQGGAVAQLLLRRGHRVRAFTRQPDAIASRELKRLGAEIFQGSFDDRASLEHAMSGMDSVFAMGTPFEGGVSAEVRQGRNIADAAKAANVSHYVYSSVANANRDTGIPFFDSKEKVESYIREIGLPYSIVGPAFFMANIFRPDVLAELRRGVLALPLPQDCGLQQVALEDLAGFVTLIMEHPAQFLKRRFDIASDELTGRQEAEQLHRVTGLPIVYREIDIEEARVANPEAAMMYDWLNHVGTDIDVELVRRQFPEVGWHHFEEWANLQDWELLRRKAA